MSPAIDAETISAVGVLGLGTMGHGIAQTMAAAGCTVRGYDESPLARASLLPRIRANLEQMAGAGVFEESAIDDVLHRIVVCDSEAEAADGAQFVTEAVREDRDVKRAMFARLEPLVSADAILASNTSSYPMSDIAEAMQRPQRALVTHWFNPPHIVPVVEVVPGRRTSPGTVTAACRFLERIGKLPVRLNREVPGFLVNRVQIAMMREVWDLLDREVASAEEIDRAIQGSMGLRLAALGPLAIIDFAGWDVTARVYQNLVPHLRGDTELPGKIQQLLDQERYGFKSGRGVYSYPPDTSEQSTERDHAYLKLIEALSRIRAS